MFALEWCEFCWSVRKFLKALEIPYRSIDLDSVEYQRDDFGGEIRAALRARTQASTIPQVFVGGEHFGGCTDLFRRLPQGPHAGEAAGDGRGLAARRATRPLHPFAQVAAEALTCSSTHPKRTTPPAGSTRATANRSASS
jgi:cysteine synthase A